MGDHTLTYEQVTALLAETERKMLRCSDCVHWDAGGGYDTRDMAVDMTMSCNRGRWQQTDLRSMFRTAASCDDFTPAPEDQG